MDDANVRRYDVSELVDFEEQPDWSVLPVPKDVGVTPCFVPCGQPACQALGCVRLYNARRGYVG